MSLKFWTGMQRADQIGLNYKMMFGRDDIGDVVYGDVFQLITMLNASTGAAFNPTYVAPGGTLPAVTTQQFLFVGTGTFNKPGGGSIVTTERLNILAYNGTAWVLLMAVPITLDMSDYTKTVDFNQVKAVLYDTGGSNTTYGNTDDFATYTSTSTSTATRLFGTQLTNANKFKGLSVKATRAGVIKFRLFNKNTDGTFSFVAGSEFSLTLAVGNNTFTEAQLAAVTAAPQVGQYLGFYHDSASSFIAYKTGTQTSYELLSSDFSSANGAFTTKTNLNFALNFIVGPASGAVVPGLISNVAANTAAIAAQALLIAGINTSLTAINGIMNGTPGGFEALGETGDMSTITTLASNMATRIFGPVMSKPGKMLSVTFNNRRTGIIYFRIFTKNADGTFNYTGKSFNINAVVGVQTVTSDVFGNVPIAAGEYLGFYHTATSGMLGYLTQTTYTSYENFGVDFTGSNGTFTTKTNLRFAIAWTNGTTGDPTPGLPQRVSVNESSISSIQQQLANISGLVNLRKGIRQAGNIVYTKFNTTELPVNYVRNGAWTATVNGMQSPSSGGWGTNLYWNKLLDLEEHVLKANIVINSATSVFGIGNFGQAAKWGGTYIEVDCASAKMTIYTQVKGPVDNTPTVVTEYAFASGFTITANREYELYLFKKSEVITFVIYDTIAQNFSSFNINNGTVGIARDCPGIGFKQGQITVLSMNWDCPLPKNPRILFLTDSFGQGQEFRNSDGGSYAGRWVAQLGAKLNGNWAMIAQGGETSATLLAKLPLITQLFDRPEVVVLVIGTNDGNNGLTFNQYKANVEAIITPFIAKGSEIVLTNCAPRSGNDVLFAQINTYVQSSSYKVIDIARAMTVNGDRVTNDASKRITDNLHPNISGNNAIANEAFYTLFSLFQ